MRSSAAIYLARAFICFGACNALVTPSAYAQATKENVVEAMDRLKSGEFYPGDVNLIAASIGVQAVPELKQQFETVQDQVSKGSIASALVRLNDKDPAPWNYLVKGVSDVIASDAPCPQRFDANGKLIAGLWPEFVDWAKAHNLSNEALETEMLVFFGT